MKPAALEAPRTIHLLELCFLLVKRLSLLTRVLTQSGLVRVSSMVHRTQKNAVHGFDTEHENCSTSDDLWVIVYILKYDDLWS